MTMYQNWRDVPKDKWRWPNFSPRELACKGTGRLLVDEVALDALQRLRDELGRPIIVVSAYRSPEHNRKVGGARNSYHVRGMAADIQVRGVSPEDVYTFCDEAFPKGGVGKYSTFTHIDCRGYKARW